MILAGVRKRNQLCASPPRRRKRSLASSGRPRTNGRSRPLPKEPRRRRQQTTASCPRGFSRPRSTTTRCHHYHRGPLSLLGGRLVLRILGLLLEGTSACPARSRSDPWFQVRVGRQEVVENAERTSQPRSTTLSLSLSLVTSNRIDRGGADIALGAGGRRSTYVSRSIRSVPFPWSIG
jgi:hypothetical protein